MAMGEQTNKRPLPAHYGCCMLILCVQLASDCNGVTFLELPWQTILCLENIIIVENLFQNYR